MDVIPYRSWVDYVREIARRQGHTMRHILDVGCGTGTASLLLAHAGYQVTGIDISAAMVDQASAKAEGVANARFLACPLEKLDLDTRFDTAISLFDSLNYITEPSVLQEGFTRLARHMEPGGYFLFDMNTPYALEQELFTQDNLSSSDPLRYVWKSRYDQDTRLTTVEMTFYVRDGEKTRLIRETHLQRAYRLNEIKGMLEQSGFETIDVLEAYTFRRPGKRTDRAFFIARRTNPEEL